MTILTSVMQFAMLPLQGLGQGAQPIISYNYATKKESRVNQIAHDSLFISYFFMLLGVITFWLIPDPLMKIFHADQNVLKIGRIESTQFIFRGQTVVVTV